METQLEMAGAFKEPASLLREADKIMRENRQALSQQLDSHIKESQIPAQKAKELQKSLELAYSNLFSIHSDMSFAIQL